VEDSLHESKSQIVMGAAEEKLANAVNNVRGFAKIEPTRERDEI